MPELADQIAAAVGVPVARLSPAGRQHGYRHATGTLADGRAFFAKGASKKDNETRYETDDGTAAAFTAEANGLRWLAEADGSPPVPRVLGLSAGALVLELVEPQRQPAPAAARRLGAGLARLHAAGAESFGAPWPGVIASLLLDNTQGTGWPAWYAERRLAPYLRQASDAGAIPDACVSLVEAVIARIGELAGPPEPPSRIHGDLWSGNVLWSGETAWLIDPAAHGGHRETDLAMLALFATPHLADIIHGYTAVTPLADGWRSRIPLHQLHPLLVHVCLFGDSYVSALTTAAEAALAC